MKFRITTILAYITVICLALAWYADRTQLSQALEKERAKTNPRIGSYGEKHNLWAAKNFIAVKSGDTRFALENRLNKITTPKISFGPNSTVPSQKNLKVVSDLMTAENSDVQLLATQLAAVYLGYGQDGQDKDGLALRGYMHSRHSQLILDKLNSHDQDVVRAAALCAGNLFYTKRLANGLKAAFERTDDFATRNILAWAYYHLTNEY